MATRAREDEVKLSNHQLLASIERVARDALQTQKDPVSVLDEIAQLAAQRSMNPRSVRLVDRNKLIVEEHKAGATLQKLSEKYGLTRARCWQISQGRR
jgi:DNA-directed RNA polymerase sigma subunit (sigma70/sigma32)